MRQLGITASARIKSRFPSSRIALRIICWLLVGSRQLIPVDAANFTSGSADALRYGTPEIVLEGDGGVANPFETVARVSFTPPSGAAKVVTVDAFYDAGNTWRARVYVTEVGRRRWASTCDSNARLNGQAGGFLAGASAVLPGNRNQKPGHPNGTESTTMNHRHTLD